MRNRAPRATDSREESVARHNQRSDRAGSTRESAAGKSSALIYTLLANCKAEGITAAGYLDRTLARRRECRGEIKVVYSPAVANRRSLKMTRSILI